MCDNVLAVDNVLNDDKKVFNSKLKRACKSVVQYDYYVNEEKIQFIQISIHNFSSQDPHIFNRRKREERRFSTLS